MCGISGYFNITDLEPVGLRQARVTAMCDLIRHRGPDDVGCYVPEGDPVALGAVRLSIVDLAGGHQPLATADGTLWIAFNGEIYNFRDLRDELAAGGHVFHTHSDTEVVVHAFEAWGRECLHRFNGMFALAIWDARRKELFLARDRLGKKPLYYWRDKHSFVFGSEIKSVLVHPRVERHVDPIALDLYLSLGYVPGPRTLFGDIAKLEPGHWMVVRADGSIGSERYWDVPAPRASTMRNGNTSRSDADYIDAVRETLQDAVRIRMVADVPVGVLLSGGLDSSAVVACVPQDTGNRLKSFSVRFSSPEHDEHSFALEVASTFSTDHYEQVGDQCAPDLLRKLIWHGDEPVADPAMVPTYLVSKLAREQVKVVLTGEGADELFGGYFYHPLAGRVAALDAWPGWVRHHGMVPAALAVNRILHRQRYHPRTLWSWRLENGGRLIAWTAIFTDEEKHALLDGNPQLHGSKSLTVELLQETANRADGTTWLQQSLYTDIKVPLVDDLLMKVDKMSMAASLEARCPFLDYRLVELAAEVPDHLKLSDGQNKIVLRRAMSGALPPIISSREKHGFDVPIRRWLLQDLRELFWDSVTAEPFQRLGVSRPDKIREMWADLESGVPGRARQLWSLLCLAVWQDIYQVSPS